MSHEHRALGFRPPPSSLAAEAQAQTAPIEVIDAGVAAQIYGKALYLVSGTLECVFRIVILKLGDLALLLHA